MAAYLVTTRVTQYRKYWVNANDEKKAIEMTTNMSPGAEQDDGAEETISVEELED